METLFENTYKRTREVVTETMRYMYFQKPWSIVYWAVLVGMTVFMTALIVWARYFSWMGAMYYALAAYITLRNLYRFRKSIRLQIARDREQYGEEPVAVDTFFSQSGIGIHPQAGKPVEIAYENIKYAAQTKQLIIFFTQAKLYHTVHKDGFTKGSAAECLAFLKEKGIKIR